jgi:tetratricopeptide (TPR) repeat protein
MQTENEAKKYWGVYNENTTRKEGWTMNEQNEKSVQERRAEQAYQRGVSLWMYGKYFEAYQEFQEAVDLQPNNEAYLQAYGAVADCVGMQEDTIEAFERLVSIDGDNSDYLFMLGSTMACVGDTYESLKYLRKAHALDPDNPWWLRAFCCALCKEELYEEATQYAEKAFNAHPDKMDFYKKILEEIDEAKKKITSK